MAGIWTGSSGRSANPPRERGPLTSVAGDALVLKARHRGEVVGASPGSGRVTADRHREIVSLLISAEDDDDWPGVPGPGCSRHRRPKDHQAATVPSPRRGRRGRATPRMNTGRRHLASTSSPRACYPTPTTSRETAGLRRSAPDAAKKHALTALYRPRGLTALGPALRR